MVTPCLVPGLHLSPWAIWRTCKFGQANQETVQEFCPPCQQRCCCVLAGYKKKQQVSIANCWWKICQPSLILKIKKEEERRSVKVPTTRAFYFSISLHNPSRLHPINLPQNGILHFSGYYSVRRYSSKVQRGLVRLQAFSVKLLTGPALSLSMSFRHISIRMFMNILLVCSEMRYCDSPSCDELTSSIKLLVLITWGPQLMKYRIASY